MPKLQNWFVTADGKLSGEISDDSRFTDGEFVTTSAIKGKRGDTVITNSGTEYNLGEPQQDYEAQFHPAKKRLIESLPTI